MNMCRVCLLESKLSVTSLNKSINNRTVADMIIYLAGIETSINDRLPQIVCSDCLSLVISACRIKDVCINSDRTLRHQIKDEEYEACSQIKTESRQDILEIDISNEHNSLVNLPSIYPDVLEIDEHENVRKIASNKKIRTVLSGQLNFKVKQSSKQKLREPQLPFKCYLCNMEFNYRKEKHKHLEEFHATDEFKCTLCKHKSQTARGLDNHLMLHENPDLLFHMCHICGKKNYQKACELRRHIKLAHGDKSMRQINFFCDHCDFKTFSKMNMKRHLNTIHLKIKAFGCQLCPDKKYTSKITLDQHMISKHGQDTDFVCQCCRRKFPTMSFLRSHMKSTCSGSPGSVRERGDPNEYREPLYDELDHYRCKLCGLVFEGKGKIAQHYAQRHKHNNSCDLCSATFNSYSNLKKHIQILHNKIHKYVCSFCSRSFGQKNQLQSHINTHTGDKPFRCKFEICNFRSGDLSAVSKHQKKCTNNPVNKL